MTSSNVPSSNCHVHFPFFTCVTLNKVSCVRHGFSKSKFIDIKVLQQNNQIQRAILTCNNYYPSGDLTIAEPTDMQCSKTSASLRSQTDWLKSLGSKGNDSRAHLVKKTSEVIKTTHEKFRQWLRWML